MEDESGIAFWELVKKETSKYLSVPVPTKAIVRDEEDGEEGEEENQEKLARVILRYVKLHHDLKKIIGDKDAGILMRIKVKENSCMISKLYHKTIREALTDEDWTKAMEEEVDQIEKNATWSLVPRPEHNNVIITK